MRVGILTSTDIRHRYFVNALRRHCQVVAVCYQDTGYQPAAVGAGTLDAHSARIVHEHFAERSRQESLFFGHDAALLTDGPACRVRGVDVSNLSSADTVTFLRDCAAEVLIVYGTSLIREPLLSAFAGRILNLHLGLSPYYRGTATNFYPLLNEEPEYVGATILLLDAGIDSGPIVHHARPEINADDGPHTVGCKAIVAGLERMVDALQDLEADALQPVPQWRPPNPRLYLRKHFHPEQVVRLYELIAAGLFPQYVARRERVENAMRLVQ